MHLVVEAETWLRSKSFFASEKVLEILGGARTLLRLLYRGPSWSVKGYGPLVHREDARSVYRQVSPPDKCFQIKAFYARRCGSSAHDPTQALEEFSGFWGSRVIIAGEERAQCAHPRF